MCMRPEKECWLTVGLSQRHRHFLWLLRCPSKHRHRGFLADFSRLDPSMIQWNKIWTNMLTALIIRHEYNLFHTLSRCVFITPSLLALARFSTFGASLKSSQLLTYFVWLRITDEGSVPKMRIWSILLIKSDLKWCIHLGRSLFSYLLQVAFFK